MLKNSQYKLMRSQAGGSGRVIITYDLELGDAIIQKSLPFILGIIGNFSGDKEDKKTFAERNFINVDSDNFNDVIKALNPKANIIYSLKGESNGITLDFSHFDDFSPIRIIKRIPELFMFYERRIGLADLKTRLLNNRKLLILAEKLLNDFQNINVTDLLKDFSFALEEQRQYVISLFELLKTINIEKNNIKTNENSIGNEQNINKENKSEIDKKSNSQDKKSNSQDKKSDTQDKKSDTQDKKSDTQDKKSDTQEKSDDAKKIDHDDPIMNIQKHISQIDQILSESLDSILHHPNFQSLESRWTGMYFLLKNTTSSSTFKIKILDASLQDINLDLIKVMEFYQSHTFKKIYEENYGTYGGEPFSMILFDSFINGFQEEFNFLFRISEVISSAHVPTIFGVNSTLFNLDNYLDLNLPNSLSKVFDSPQFMKWKSFRETEDAKYIGFVLPRFMGRNVYGYEQTSDELSFYIEKINNNNDFLWVNSVYAYGTNVVNAFLQYGWLAAIVGPENGGMVSNLNIYIRNSESGDKEIVCPTEVIIPDRREKELSQMGFMPLCYCKGTDFAAFFSAQSAFKPPLTNQDDANANGYLAAKLSCTLNIARFAHYLKVMLRDKIGSFVNKDSLVLYLKNWIMQYVLLNDTNDQETKAKYPLKSVKIDIVEDLSRPGAYSAKLFLIPHFQLDEIKISLRIVARIPAAK